MNKELFKKLLIPIAKEIREQLNLDYYVSYSNNEIEVINIKTNEKCVIKFEDLKESEEK